MSSTSEASDTDFLYTTLPTEQKEQKTKYKVSLNGIKKSTRNKVFGGGCWCLLMTFLLCFFLIPRNPKVYLENIIFYDDGGYGTFNFKNNNYYKETWKNPDISLYWLPYDGQTVGSICYTDDDPCDAYIRNNCAIQLGEFKNDEHFTTQAKTNKHRQISLVSSTQKELACTSWMLLNPYQGMSQRLITTGNVKGKNMMQDYKKRDISTEYYYYY